MIQLFFSFTAKKNEANCNFYFADNRKARGNSAKGSERRDCGRPEGHRVAGVRIGRLGSQVRRTGRRAEWMSCGFLVVGAQLGPQRVRNVAGDDRLLRRSQVDPRVQFGGIQDQTPLHPNHRHFRANSSGLRAVIRAAPTVAQVIFAFDL